jgi:carbon storage regulator
MLILQRRVGERIVIGGGIEITVAAVTPKAVRLAVDAPREVTVLRGEVYDAITAADGDPSLAAGVSTPRPRGP